MRTSEIIPQEVVESKIFFIRGKKVMLDRDLAALYGVEPRALNQATRRNIKRFPEDFMFQLSQEEALELSRSQFVTLKSFCSPDLIKLSKAPIKFLLL